MTQSSLDDEERKLSRIFHQRLLEGDPLVTMELAEVFLPKIFAYLKRQFPSTEDEIIRDASTEAYFKYVEQPATFNPDLHSLLGYLQMSARGDVLNSLAKQRRRQRKLVPLETVALTMPDGNINLEDQIINRQEATLKILEWKRERQEEVEVIAETELDRQLLDLVQNRVRSTSEYARLLGIEDRSQAEQRQIVKRHKDRLRLRLKRNRASTSKLKFEEESKQHSVEKPVTGE